MKNIGEIGKDFTPLSYSNPGIRLSLAPDGKIILCPAARRTNTLWMLERFRPAGLAGPATGTYALIITAPEVRHKRSSGSTLSNSSSMISWIRAVSLWSWDSSPAHSSHGFPLRRRHTAHVRGPATSSPSAKPATFSASLICP